MTNEQKKEGALMSDLNCFNCGKEISIDCYGDGDYYVKDGPHYYCDNDCKKSAHREYDNYVDPQGYYQ